MNFKKSLTIFTILISIMCFSQTPVVEGEKLSLNSGTIDNQFDYIIKNSNGWDNEGQAYKVIKLRWLTDLKKHTLDSLSVIRKKLKANEITVNNQAQEIENLKNSLLSIKNNLNKIKKSNDTMSFFGLQLSKSLYSFILWFIVFIIFAFLLFFIYKFKNSNIVTQEAKRALLNLENEYEEHRKTALEREQKVRRQLQDEINKQKNITNPKK